MGTHLAARAFVTKKHRFSTVLFCLDKGYENAGETPDWSDLRPYVIPAMVLEVLMSILCCPL